jgi:hypothetical protein
MLPQLLGRRLPVPVLAHGVDAADKQAKEPSTNDGDVATIDCKHIAQKLIASTKQQSKMLAMNALLSPVSSKRLKKKTRTAIEVA